ncbi:MAG: hypothetical protein UY70_C0024G0007 [Candidatus Kaiserbacteria bacterium GW2011_GWB1_52_6]|uniref:DNA polymerase III delta N-terminal domain-containing protein n=2 Tax=Candidatus Kaiseribacteriota TaxID=1752734 RepID=A0A0G1X629_9BACT|nr:MAG: hypothetical protein UY67_C0003G0011 [Candidatus Kaiserbacteria bacterium GW2011_GWA2_52_12]KKW26441.1 MAG: hypothetical protein UY70_C0024G0007 [Candidatus Kaiserbacteria bacterium GW2011_GWB1_52_6]
MLHLYTGTDREKAREEMNTAVKKVSLAGQAKDTDVVRVTDAHTPADLKSVFEGAGMFGGVRTVVLEGVWGNEEMRALAETNLKYMRDSEEHFFIFEEKPDAATRKSIEKYAEDSKRFDLKKGDERTTIFALASALRSGNKKALWVSYQRELVGNAPEAIHGVLFWGAKDMLLKARSDSERSRARKLIAQLAELPHESRRRGVELEYALERVVLSVA